ncbi:2OG-Fe(II) oxygenase [Siccirubricoccus sp. KC 17139]|uniref:2OG-Fe(II) oxygenase n=1 Tax=Siccirubricoccus soli TaxID=2899147 RepID=A0ABT1DD91_9PROT|nr:2OG-Fe(II) oxygenase [Siccirubricoccus soli]MCO6419913.1 2OG-Fe(II) oxygenase [Siccirubricoccus soli]MCP2686048.1 2OG-Fe(II) oxygenase [Siccirubricoccus soli]
MSSSATRISPAAPETARILNLAPLLAATPREDPYPWAVAAGCVAAAALPALRRDFPRIDRPGYHPVEQLEPRGSFAALLAEIEAGALDDAMTRLFGPDFAALPRLVTVQRLSAREAGRPHTDSARKAATLLLYLNPAWASSEGCIRVLRSEDLADVVAEWPPVEGHVFAFLRGPDSWHGHTPFVGERRVVQVAWLRDRAALAAKQRQHRFTWWLKGVFRRH